MKRMHVFRTLVDSSEEEEEEEDEITDCKRVSTAFTKLPENLARDALLRRRRCKYSPRVSRKQDY